MAPPYYQIPQGMAPQMPYPPQFSMSTLDKTYTYTYTHTFTLARSLALSHPDRCCICFVVNPAILPVMGVGYPPSRMVPFKDPSIKSQVPPSPYSNSVFNGRGMPMVPEYYSPWDSTQQDDERTSIANAYNQNNFMVPGPRRDDMGLMSDSNLFKAQTRTSPLYGGSVSPQRSASIEKIKPRHSEYEAATHSRSSLLEEFRSNKNNRKFELQVCSHSHSHSHCHSQSFALLLFCSLSSSTSHDLQHITLLLIVRLYHHCRTLKTTLLNSAKINMALGSFNRSWKPPTYKTSNWCSRRFCPMPWL
jgi:hypothetical protein